MSPESGTVSSGTQKLSSNKSMKCTSSTALSPPSAHKNHYSLLSNLNDDNNDDMSPVTQSKQEIQQPTEVSQKLPPIHVHNKKVYVNFHNS